MSFNLSLIHRIKNQQSYIKHLSAWGSPEETQKLANWLDVSIVKRQGRAFKADLNLLPKESAIIFPPVRCSTLTDKAAVFPDDIGAKTKFIAVSFKHYGFTLVRSWMDPFRSAFPVPSSKLQAAEICFVEFGFLSMAKGMFINNLKSQIPEEQQSNTAFAFGGVKVFNMLWL